jgi:hypothetical protein
MKVEPLRQKLLAAARATPPSDSVPYAFEKRIVARLALDTVADSCAVWARALWVATVPCVAVLIVVASMSASEPDSNSNTRISSEEFTADFEQTMLAAVDQSGEVW